MGGDDATLHAAFRYTERSLQARLESARLPYHPVAKGDVAEDTWRTLFRRFLPSRFSVESGFVIDAHDAISKQIDCIVYDRMFTPTFWGERGYTYVPAEAVHGVFEIKPHVNKPYLRQTSEVLESVRVLHRTSAPYMASGREEGPKPLFPIVGGLLATRMKYSKGVNAPAFAAFLRKMQQGGGTKRCLDIVLTAFDGYADYFNTGFPTDGPPCRDVAEGAATRGLFRLVKALLLQGTVGAIDLEYYLKTEAGRDPS